MATAIRLLIITAKNRFVGKYFSVRQGLRAWRYALVRGLDLIVGMRNMEQVGYLAQLTEEFHKFMVQELIIDVI